MWRSDEAGSRGYMWVQQVMTAAAMIAVSMVGAGAVVTDPACFGCTVTAERRVNVLPDLRCCDAVS